VDLFDPSSGQQLHDNNGGIHPSGLFWVYEVPPGGLEVDNDGRRATLQVSDLPVFDSFQLLGPLSVPAAVTFSLTWHATGPFVPRGKGNGVPPTDPAAFLGSFAEAAVEGSFSGRELGFSFKSEPGVSARRGYALIGHERNGAALKN
jgi:hypothetical protein